MTAIYTVEITNPSENGGSSGFIDHQKIEIHGIVDPLDSSKTVTTNQSKAKKKANLRYTRIMANIQTVSNLQVLAVTALGATASSEATKFSTTLKFDHDEALYIRRDGVTMTGLYALQHLVAEAMITDESQVCDYYSTAAVAITELVEYEKLMPNIGTAKRMITVTRI